VYSEDGARTGGRGTPAGAASRRRCTHLRARELPQAGETKARPRRSVATVHAHPERSVAEIVGPNTGQQKNVETEYVPFRFDGAAAPSGSERLDWVRLGP